MSALEDTLLNQMRLMGVPEPEREYRFAAEALGRQWRFDFAWPDKMLAVEAEGGTWARGRHVRGGGFERDCEKYNAAAMLGWRVLRYTSSMIDDGRAMVGVMEALHDS